MPSRAPSLVLAAALLAGAAACTATPPPAEPVDAQVQAVTRDHAVAHAQRDAHFRFGAVTQGVDVQRRGGFWIVELRRSDGGGLRYAISAQDGAIKERFTFQ